MDRASRVARMKKDGVRNACERLEDVITLGCVLIGWL
jgi:hypothetical protein